MASTAGTPSSIPFSFALSQGPPSSLKNGSPKPKTDGLVNPLLAKTGSTPTKKAAPAVVGGDKQQPVTALQRLPLAPVHNGADYGLRQRRKTDDNGANGSSKMPPPPKASLTMGGFIGNKKDRIGKVGNGSDTQVISWGGVDSPQMTTENATTTTVLDDSYDRWVVVYGYTTSDQYDAIVRRFDTFGKVTSRRGTCRPGTSNWVAFQYESSLQAEKALCQQHSMIADGILVGVTRMDPSLRQSLEWNTIASAYTGFDDGSLLSVRKQRLDDKFRESLDQGSSSYGMREQDILLTSGDYSRSRSSPDNARKSVCERFLAWVFEW